MSEDMGVPPSGSGYQPSASAVPASQSGIPNAWTPGPWALEEHDGGLPSVAMSHEKAWMHFDPSVSSFGYDAAEEMRANARLIAAAPELLEALRRANGVLRDYVWACAHTEEIDAEESDVVLLAEIDALLAKIGGAV